MSDALPISPGAPAADARTVLLMSAPIPFIGVIAHHAWFVVEADGRTDRWEVWQHRNVGGMSCGHLHQNLQPAFADVGAGGVLQLATYEGDTATALTHRIETSPTRYPFCNRYVVWPGPNSNTWVAWVLNGCQAAGRSPLGWKLLGSGFANLIRNP